MGLIQTAIMTGGGMYAVSKLARGMERNNSNARGSSQQYPSAQSQVRCPNQKYYGPPPPQGQKRFHDMEESYYYDQEGQQRVYHAPPLGPPPSMDASREYQENTGPRQGNQGYVYRNDNGTQSPPPYAGGYQRPQDRSQGLYSGQYQGQGYEQRGYDDGGRVGGGMDSGRMMEMAALAMNAVSGGDEKGKGKRGKKGMEMIGELMK